MDVGDNYRPGVGESCTGGEGSNTGDDFNDDDISVCKCIPIVNHMHIQTLCPTYL